MCFPGTTLLRIVFTKTCQRYRHRACTVVNVWYSTFSVVLWFSSGTQPPYARGMNRACSPRRSLSSSTSCPCLMLPQSQEKHYTKESCTDPGHRGSMHLTRHSASRIWKYERDTDMNLPECSTHGSQSSLNSRTFQVLLTLLT